VPPPQEAVHEPYVPATHVYVVDGHACVLQACCVTADGELEVALEEVTEKTDKAQVPPHI